MLEGGAVMVAPIPELEFRDKVTALGALHHENLVPPRAYFYSREEKLLRVYDFVGAGSLSSLHDNRDGGASPERLDFTSRSGAHRAGGVAFELQLVGADVPLKRVTGRWTRVQACHWGGYGQIHFCSYPDPNNYYPLLTLLIPTHIQWIISFVLDSIHTQSIICTLPTPYPPYFNG
jgi:hypothetical protein